MHPIPRRSLGAAALAAALLTGCVPAGLRAEVPEPVAEPDTLLAAVRDHDELTTLLGLVEDAGLEGLLSRPELHTLFAPSDAAFARVPDAALDRYREDPEALGALLRSHLVPGSFTFGELSDVEAVADLDGEPLDLEGDGGELRVEGAAVVDPDVGGGGDIVHVVDRVLLVPPVPGEGG